MLTFLLDPSTLTFALLLSVAHSVGLFGTHALTAWMHRNGVAARHRTSERSPPEALLRKASRKVAGNQLAFLVGSVLVLTPALRLAGMRLAGPLPSVGEVLLHLALFVLVTDASFYWMHRGLHHPWWFRKVHRHHHEFKYVRSVSAEWSHPVEDLGNLVTTLLGPLLLQPHAATVVLWMFLRMVETADAHSGYAWPGSPWSARHAFHHSHNHGNFGAFFGVWDRLLGTDRAYREHRASHSA